MHVEAATRFFSLHTVTAIQTAVELKELPQEALTTAALIKLVYVWFEMVNSKVRKTSIIKKYVEMKLQFLVRFTEIIENTQFNFGGWKPLHCGLIMTTLSIYDLSRVVFSHGYDFLLTHRFTQDALENVFSQVRRRAGKLPAPKDCLNVMKIISISQFISDVKRTSYSADSDITLIEHCKNLANEAKQTNSSENETQPRDHTYYFDRYSLNSYSFETVPLRQKYTELNLKSLNLFYNIGGSTVNSCMKNCCAKCNTLLQDCQNEVPSSWKLYKNFLNMGGLKEPSAAVLHLLVNCELIYRKFKGHIVHNDAAGIVTKIIKEINIEFAGCENGCDLKRKIVRHFFVIRNYSVVNFYKSIKKKKTVYGSASKK